MDKTQEELRILLSRIEPLSAPPPLKRRTKRRIRIHQAISIASVLLLGGLSTVSAARILEGGVVGQPIPPAQSTKQDLYALDFAPGGRPVHSAILKLEIDSGESRVADRYVVGDDAEVAVAPDGSRVYAVSRIGLDTDSPSDEFVVIDTSTGRTIQRTKVANWQGTTGIHVTDKMAASPDGSAVHFLVGYASSPETAPQAIATFDTRTGGLLPENAALEGCGDAPSLHALPALRIVVVCRQVNEIRFIQLSATGGIADETRLELPVEDRSYEDSFGNEIPLSFVAGSAMSPDGTRLFAVSRYGMIFRVDVPSAAIDGNAQIALPSGHWIGVPHVALSPGGDVLYLGTGSESNLDAITGEAVLSIDADSLQEIDTSATRPFTNFEVGLSGNPLFLLDSSSGRLGAFDAREHRNLGPIGMIGGRPVSLISPGL